MNSEVVKSLFKPLEIKNKTFVDFLDDETERNFYKHCVWFECSKSLDESCINTECSHNYIKLHNDDLYKELLQEVQQERKEVEEKSR